eukprot:Protomagalhaensia_wolfi_Nauph_80__4453@NODE_4566_length_546_cov_5_769231_g3661_i0_p1_GENE_NODE_4566_length_546_cov_5_769231_g3661_i0NODE_4566_length_546_cov_5_769231_g3661_i0_p1_ORF_typecomplete_len103_score7_46BAT/PF15915_5/0_077_NODE_4566_length_546_cov_5_769231_g3661_i0173481
MSSGSVSQPCPMGMKQRLPLSGFDFKVHEDEQIYLGKLREALVSYFEVSVSGFITRGSGMVNRVFVWAEGIDVEKAPDTATDCGSLGSTARTAQEVFARTFG